MGSRSLQARSRDRRYPGISEGAVLTRVRPYPVRLRSPPRRRPAAAVWLVTRDISQRAEPDVRPLSRAVSTFIAERTRRLPTLMSGDVPLSIYCVLSTPLVGGARAILQTAHLSSPLSNSAPVPRGALCPSSLIREASPTRRGKADLGCQGARRLL
jgi:hypothetical protein